MDMKISPNDIAIALNVSADLADPNLSELATETLGELDTTAGALLQDQLGLPNGDTELNPVLPAVLLWAAFQVATKQGWSVTQVLTLVDNLTDAFEHSQTEAE